MTIKEINKKEINTAAHQSLHVMTKDSWRDISTAIIFAE